jgi:hypothetical protein
MREEILKILDNYHVELQEAEGITEELLNLHIVSNPLPSKDEVIAEGNKQIEDWLSENSEHDQRVYRVAFRRSYEYVLRFIK